MTIFNFLFDLILFYLIWFDFNFGFGWNLVWGLIMDQKQHRISLKCLQQFLDLPAWQTQTDPRLQPFFSPFADSPHIPSRTIRLFRFSLFTLLVILILIVIPLLLPLLLLSMKGSLEIHIWSEKSQITNLTFWSLLRNKVFQFFLANVWGSWAIFWAGRDLGWNSYLK